MDGDAAGRGLTEVLETSCFMRRSIRRQILVPLVVIQTITVAAITAAGVGLAARRSEQQNVRRLDAVIDVLGRSHFPLTSGVLAQMHGLSGAHFLARDADGRTTAASDPALGELADRRRVDPHSGPSRVPILA